MRLQLKPGLRRVWRAPDTVQIGLSQRRGTVVGGLTADDVPLLERLREGIDATAVEAAGPAPQAERGRELVRLLEEARVLAHTATGAPVRDRFGATARQLTPDATIWSVVHQQAEDGWELLAARSTRRVVVRGAGRLGSTLAATLAAAGVGQVSVGDGHRVTEADLAPGGAGKLDVGRPRQEAALEAVRRLGGQAIPAGTDPGQWATDRPDLVVLIEYGAADAAAADHLVSSDLAHLSVVVREDDVVVGPLWRPGSGPCLRCLDLHRGDRDPAWPSILTQLLGSPGNNTQPEETALSVLGAGLAGLQVLSHLDGLVQPASIGATLEIELPDGLIARRSWPAHPRCGCHWPPPPGPTPMSDESPDNDRSGDPRSTESPAGARESPDPGRMQR